MFQAEKVFIAWKESGEFAIPDGVSATIKSTRADSDPQVTRRLTWIEFPDGSSLSIGLSVLLGLASIHLYLASDKDEISPEFETWTKENE